MVGECVNVIDPDVFFLFLKGRCHGNQFYGKIWQNYGKEKELTSTEHTARSAVSPNWQ